ncbi:uncharacterized protein LOC108833930 [Raphanus sativus]|uniref:Uncharacterized protein LOC108833930 n=1 Tax=Raphanus sativus TaxID=3726 RepID=A0A6J0LRB8_RAPSA|nr:uncharacterized protein LOC108833930 [Raphanus sativus]
MSTRIRMALVVNLLSLIFSTTIVHSNQSTVPLRSFKISENVTYDCIDIYKQPGLSHPLLKTHKIQMQSSISKPELKMQNGKNETSNKKKIGCPNGYVPILRTTKGFVTNSQIFAEKHFHPLSADSPGTHTAGVRSSNGPFRGVQAWFSANALNVGKDQVSYSQIYIGSGSKNQVNYISAGWMINPSLYGDQRVWVFGFWKGKDGKGCYNTACPGFVQVSKVIPIVEPYVLKPGVPGWVRYFIHQDKNTGNWWITQLMDDAPNEDIGYWPKELFNLLDNGANMVGAGGVVQASPSGSSPPMGNGILPNGGPQDSGVFTNIKVLNSNYKQSQMDSFRIESLVDSVKCYGLRIGSQKRFTRLGYFFNYGGLGGNKCGV